MRLPGGLDPVSLARRAVGNPLGARAAAAGLRLRARLQRQPTGQAARQSADTLNWLGASEQAEKVLDSAIANASLDEAALLRCRVEVLRMNRTRRRLPNTRVQALATRALARLDSRWALGEVDIAEELSDVLRLLFHGELHLADQPSPLLDRGSDWLAPLRGSQLGRLLLASDAPAPRPTSDAGRSGQRIAFITQGSRTFLDPLVAGLAGQGIQTRVLDIAEHQGILKHFSIAALVERRLARELGEQPPLPAPFAEIVEWADVVHAEWGTTTAAMLSMCDAPARKVVRVHAFETRTLWMPLIDWRNIDQTLLVSPALAKMCTVRYPALAANEPVMVRNISEFARFANTKIDESGRTLAMIGWNQVIKDPKWCLELLERLRAADDSWRLLLVGRSMQAADDYAGDVLAHIERLGDAVELVPFTRDIPAVLRRVGVIVSASLSEGTHEALAEGAASGALPVVRNWPAVADWGGASGVYPDDWIVETPREGADRILGFSDEERTRAGSAAADWVSSNLEATAAIELYKAAYWPTQEQPNA